MCGIAGILYKDTADLDLALGRDLITMLDGCQHRGPDSTGFALYHESNGAHGCGCASSSARASRPRRPSSGSRRRSPSSAAEVLEEEAVGSTERFTVRFDGDLQSFAYAMEHAAKVVSIGESLDIIKDVGGAHDVDDAYHVAGFTGTHGIGHVRLATESDVTPDRRTRSGQPASPTWRSSTTVRSRTTGRCAAGSRSAAWSSTRTTTPS